jgi:hypothetical protein
MKFEVEVDTFEFKIAPTKKLPMKVDYLSERREVLIHATLPEKESISVDTEVDEVVVSFKHLDVRLSEDAVRELFEALPPEMLRRL